jgi:signal transduction histidine kinase
MRLAVQSLRKGKVSDQALPAIFDIIEREDRKLAQFVDELLDLGRIRAGSLHFDFATVDLAEVVREVTTRLEGELTQAGSSVDLTAEGPLTGEWDRSRLDQVVSNLLSNAIKFGLGRPIEIRLTGTAADVGLQIKDSGAGIPDDRREQIFTPFERELSVRNYGGLGLGLYIVRTIVNGLGGTLAVDSAPGSGSTFTVSLPRTRAT